LVIERKKGGHEKKSLFVPPGFAFSQETPHVAVEAKQSARFTRHPAPEFC
jgi:hypothetical protein